ncbi:MAG: hypothetical protein HY700_06140 [Gemmatimonadetes bacterium]|nr:hypothetical protein [Gemmatimonadota bacterium]
MNGRSVWVQRSTGLPLKLGALNRQAQGTVMEATPLPAGNSSHNHEGFRSRYHRLRERRLGIFVGKILFASKETQERPTLLGDVVTDRPAKHGIPGFESIEDRALRGPALDVEFHLCVHPRQRPEVRR